MIYDLIMYWKVGIVKSGNIWREKLCMKLLNGYYRIRAVKKIHILIPNHFFFVYLAILLCKLKLLKINYGYLNIVFLFQFSTKFMKLRVSIAKYR